ncbi:TonB-dependent receptor [uncultured Algimonas sp.]|uniref:TonB-dependent receptor plug domain-containing protein n=1 Tax=uncultured Algimonas sp. TaxID=1547920 RepID=UPI0026033464|nr:TonB-dependent receptor [uncultured Algimonas sp.]
MTPASAHAQTPPAELEPDDGFVVMDEIVTIGTRRTQRSAADTPAPVDVITALEFNRNASDDVQDLLRTSVPAFNVATHPISNDSTISRPANLRGLSPDQTLVLVNGKRRHRGSIITFFGGDISSGAQGVDIASIPSLALKQVEVLRDGASSQYGSDAIAGVINFVLKDAPEGGVAEFKYGSTYEEDGDEYRLSANLGLPLGPRGFVNLTAEYGEADGTDRSVIRPDVLGFIGAGNEAAADFSTITGGFSDSVPQYWGRSQIDDDLKLVLNSAFDLGYVAEAYVFGTYSQRTVSNGFFYRAPTNSDSRFAGPSVDPVTGDASTAPGAVGSIRIGDLDGLGTGASCPAGIPLRAGGNLPDPAIAARIAADANCFSLLEAYPGGFTPRFGGENTDYSIAGGLRGTWDIGSGVAYDLSIAHGSNETDFFIRNTINPSLGNASPRDFRPGGQQQTETVMNLDFAYLVDAGFRSELSIAFGGEFREESFKLSQGDPASYAVGPLALQGFGSGANGFTGFAQSVSANQHSSAAYVELETDVTDALTLQGALRYEDYSEFGDTLDYKIAGLYRITDGFTLRATHSTGFHAPTAGQANVRRITTLIEEGLPVDSARLPIDSVPVQLAADFIESRDGGRPSLDVETADVFTLGAAFDLGPTQWTIDAYHVDVDDRIAVAQDVDFTQVLAFTAAQNGVTLAPDATPGQAIVQLDAAGVLNQRDFAGFENLTNISYIANTYDTRTRGVDIVGQYPFDLFGGASELTLAVNYNETEVTDVGTVNPIGASRIASLEDLLPNWKGFASWIHNQGRWRTLLRANYFGGWDDTIYFVPDQSAELLFDAEVGYEAMDGVELIVGANNIFDNYPDRVRGFGPSFGQLYPDFSPSGFLGGHYYTKLRVSF